MTQEDIIRMAQEAGFDYSGAELTWESVICTEELKAFAALIASAEREACIVDIQMCIPRSGHDTPEMLFAKKVMERIRARL